MRTLFRLLSLAIILVIVALISAVTTIAFAVHGHEVAVPKLVGLTPEEAERTLANAGLSFMLERHFYSPDVPQGRIMSQAPQAGTSVRRGWQVRVADSLGPQRIVIPNVIGQSGRVAEIYIRDRGLELGELAVARIPDAPSDSVVAQSPMPNASGVSVPKMSMLVAAPGEPPTFVMPDFIGQPLALVSLDIEAAGLHVGDVTVRAIPAQPPASALGASTTAPGATSPNASSAAPGATAAMIVAQSPVPGSKVVAGTVVNFEVTH